MLRFVLLSSALSATAAIFTGGSYRGDDSLGSSMTLTNGANKVHPITVAEAEEQGWMSAGTGCDENLGVEYVPEGGISHDAPLSVFFTPAGQIAGLKMTVYGSNPDFGSYAFQGIGAVGNTVSQGYYIPVEGGDEDSWQLYVSFRSRANVCSDNLLADDIGDRVVINQHTIAVSVPMTAGEAEEDNYQPASCMLGMGQHYFKDLEDGSDMSWKTGNLLPITPMYYPPNDPNGKLNAFLFSSPTCQNDIGEGLWDNVPFGFCGLRFSMMCLNFCNEECSTDTFTFTSPFHSPTTHRWATYHVFFSTPEERSVLYCDEFVDKWWQPGGAGGWMAGRTCPDNTPNPHSGPTASIPIGVRGSTE